MSELELVASIEDVGGKIEGMKTWKVVDDKKERHFSALETGEGVWLVDPIRGELLEEYLEDRELLGVLVICDHHWRDAAEISNKYSVKVHVPEWFEDLPEDIKKPGRIEDSFEPLGAEMIKLLDNFLWQESAIYTGELLVLGDTLFDSEAMGGGLSYNPIVRFNPPRKKLRGLEPDVIAMGHGVPVEEKAVEKLEKAVEASRLGAFPALVKFFSRVFF